MFTDWVLYLIAIVSLGIWCITKTTSVVLLSFLFLSLSVVLLVSLKMISTLSLTLPLFMVILTFGGGVFILFAFVILSRPNDSMMGSMGGKVNMLIVFLYLLFNLIPPFSSMSSFPLVNNFTPMVWESGWSISLGGVYSLIYLFLISLLFLFLFPLNSIMSNNTGTYFSSSK